MWTVGRDMIFGFPIGIENGNYILLGCGFIVLLYYRNFILNHYEELLKYYIHNITIKKGARSSLEFYSYYFRMLIQPQTTTSIQ